MISTRAIIAKWFKDPEFRKEYEALESEFSLSDKHVVGKIEQLSNIPPDTGVFLNAVKTFPVSGEVYPSLVPGRMVHYISLGSADGKYPPTRRAAMITNIADVGLDLCVFNPEGLYFIKSVKRTLNGEEPGCWTWMPYPYH